MLKILHGAGGEGNYLVLEFPQAKDAENTVVCSYEGGSETQLDTNDCQYLIKLNQKKPITVKVTGKVNANVTLDISEIELAQKSG